MHVLKSDRIVFCDVDDTLVKWESNIDFDKKVSIECSGIIDHYEVIEENVTAIKKHKARGHKVVVWSQGGYDWAEAVVKALKIEQYVDLVCCKPTWCIDDLQPSSWMPKAQLHGNNYNE